MPKPIHYLGAVAAAEYCGVSRPWFNKNAPEPDALISNTHKGWLPETLDRWVQSIR